MLPTGILADVAPTMLKLLGIPKPDSMTGRALL
jgi:bisphosphoglycerate-independent phosphoglycerate mutase (AlkP superfamily)